MRMALSTFRPMAIKNQQATAENLRLKQPQVVVVWLAEKAQAHLVVDFIFFNIS